MQVIPQMSHLIFPFGSRVGPADKMSGLGGSLYPLAASDPCSRPPSSTLSALSSSVLRPGSSSLYSSTLMEFAAEI